MEPQAGGVLEQRREAELQAQLVEVHVAALGDRVGEDEVAVPLGRPAAEEAVAILQSAATGDRHPRPQRHDAVPQRHRGQGELPGGSGRIACLDGAVEQRVRLAHVEAAPIVGVHAAHEGVGIEARRAVQGENLACIGVQREHRAALARREDLRDVALQLEVDGGMHRAARHRREPGGRAPLAHHMPQRAHLHEAHAVRAPE
ncbi:MAG: hypothetical protein DMD56_10085 [Gemmatimonadetes bacterium]|nr:MAG: hypothetical protein DMD56_10085 [Gemmatimonadota bacterium]